MTTKYQDHDEVLHTYQEEDGDDVGQTRPVAGMPAAVRSQFTAMAASLASLAGVISSGRLLVTIQTAVETKLDTIITALGSHLSTLAGTVDSTRLKVTVDSTLLGHVDGLETHLASLVTASGKGATFRSDQNNNIDTGANRTFTSQILTYGMWIKNISTSGQIIYYNDTGVAVSASNSTELLPGEWSEFIPCTDASQVAMLPSANDAKACYHGW